MRPANAPLLRVHEKLDLQTTHASPLKARRAPCAREASLPADVDPSVLAELPADLQREIRLALADRGQARQDVGSSSRRSSRPPPITEMLRDGSLGKRKACLLDPGDVCPEVLQELPPEVAREIQQQIDVLQPSNGRSVKRKVILSEPQNRRTGRLATEAVSEKKTRVEARANPGRIRDLLLAGSTTRHGPAR